MKLIVKSLRGFTGYVKLYGGNDILFEKLTPEIGGKFEKHPSYAIPLGLGISSKVCLLFKLFLLVTSTLCLDYRTLLDLLKYWLDSWRRYSLKVVCWCADGDVVNYFGLGATSE